MLICGDNLRWNYREKERGVWKKKHWHSFPIFQREKGENKQIFLKNIHKRDSNDSIIMTRLMQYGREPGRGGVFFHHHDRRWMDRKEEVDVVDLKAYSDAVPTRDVCCVHEEHTHTHTRGQSNSVCGEQTRWSNSVCRRPSSLSAL